MLLLLVWAGAGPGLAALDGAARALELPRVLA